MWPRSVKERSDSFQTANPFPHLVIDNFLKEADCVRLAEEFPRRVSDTEAGDYGTVGKKIVRQDLPDLGPAYRELDEMLRSRQFLNLLGEVTGIDELLYDPQYVGGGTHENLEGQELDPHVDFNLHPRTGWHRRLNLILFLNREWGESWGGLLELHTNPWQPDENRIRKVLPIWNRAVAFETSEVSWHGFEQIRLPEGKKHLSRRSIAVYFYTKTRPADEIAQEHATIYVQRPLPGHIRAGHTLTDADEHRLQVLLARRDQQIRHLYSREAELLAVIRGMSRSPLQRLLSALKRLAR